MGSLRQELEARERERAAALAAAQKACAEASVTAADRGKIAVAEFIQAMRELRIDPCPIHFRRNAKLTTNGRQQTEEIPGYTILGWLVARSFVDQGYPRSDPAVIIANDGTTYYLFQGESPGARKRSGAFVPIPCEPPGDLRKYLQALVSKAVLRDDL